MEEKKAPLLEAIVLPSVIMLQQVKILLMLKVVGLPHRKHAHTLKVIKRQQADLLLMPKVIKQRLWVIMSLPFRLLPANRLSTSRILFL